MTKYEVYTLTRTIRRAEVDVELPLTTRDEDVVLDRLVRSSVKDGTLSVPAGETVSEETRITAVARDGARVYPEVRRRASSSISRRGASRAGDDERPPEGTEPPDAA